MLFSLYETAANTLLFLLPRCQREPTEDHKDINLLQLLESVRVSVADDAATLRYPDGSVLQLSTGVLDRSPLLQHAVADTDDNSEVCLSLPEGVIQAWLELLHATDGATVASFPDTGTDHTTSSPLSKVQSLSESLTVRASYLVRIFARYTVFIDGSNQNLCVLRNSS